MTTFLGLKFSKQNNYFLLLYNNFKNQFIYDDQVQRFIITLYIFQNMSSMFRLSLFLIWLHCKYQHHPVPPRAPTRHWIIPRSSFCQSLTCSFGQKLYFCLLPFGQNYDNEIRNFDEPPSGQLNPFEIRRQRAQFLLFFLLWNRYYIFC